MSLAARYCPQSVSQHPVKKRINTLEINETKNILKKSDLCHRHFSEFIQNYSGKQVTVNLSAAAYEALKNNTIFLLSLSGDVTMASETLFLPLETQYFLRLSSES